MSEFQYIKMKVTNSTVIFIFIAFYCLSVRATGGAQVHNSSPHHGGTRGPKSTLRPEAAQAQTSTLRPGKAEMRNSSSHNHPPGIPDDVKMDMIMGLQNMIDDNQLASLRGRASYSRRKSLPSGNLFSGKGNDYLTCGETYPVATNGHYFFDLAPRKQPCQYTFLGSRNEKCTVAILCNEKITLAPQSANGCDQEWLVLSDGTEGLMSGCGSFSFGGSPRIPRNNGTDIYLFIKGTSPSRCIAFCNEELRGGRPGVKPAKKVTKNKNYQGFKVETGCMCGKRRDFGRVVGGETAFKYEFPWIGAVVFKSGQFNRKPFCGGSLVNDRYFISAAHCFELSQPKVKPHEIQVILHAHVMDKRVRGNPNDPQYKDIPGWNLDPESDQSESSIRMDVQEIKSHPLFNGRTFDYDIAVLKFTRAVNLKKGKVAPVCLPYMKENFVFEDEAVLVVAGWGRPWEGAPAGSRSLQKLDVPFLNLKDCDKYTLPSKRHICAGYLEGGKDACSGDSGGPLIYQFNKDNNQYLLAGIVSAGAGCARKNNLGLYSDVQEMLQWTYKHMPDAVYCPRE